MNRKQSFRIVLAAGMIATLLSACNTVKGAGRDVESVGKAAERAID
jgi:predicted small secreted protein